MISAGSTGSGGGGGGGTGGVGGGSTGGSGSGGGGTGVVGGGGGSAKVSTRRNIIYIYVQEDPESISPIHGHPPPAPSDHHHHYTINNEHSLLQHQQHLTTSIGICRDPPHVVRRFARFHLQTALQLMGCKHVHAIEITSNIFDWLTQTKHYEKNGSSSTSSSTSNSSSSSVSDAVAPSNVPTALSADPNQSTTTTTTTNTTNTTNTNTNTNTFIRSSSSSCSSTTVDATRSIDAFPGASHLSNHVVAEFTSPAAVTIMPSSKPPPLITLPQTHPISQQQQQLRNEDSINSLSPHATSAPIPIAPPPGDSENFLVSYDIPSALSAVHNLSDESRPSDIRHPAASISTTNTTTTTTTTLTNNPKYKPDIRDFKYMKKRGNSLTDSEGKQLTAKLIDIGVEPPDDLLPGAAAAAAASSKPNKQPKEKKTSPTSSVCPDTTAIINDAIDAFTAPDLDWSIGTSHGDSPPLGGTALNGYNSHFAASDHHVHSSQQEKQEVDEGQEMDVFVQAKIEEGEVHHTRSKSLGSSPQSTHMAQVQDLLRRIQRDRAKLKERQRQQLQQQQQQQLTVEKTLIGVTSMLDSQTFSDTAPRNGDATPSTLVSLPSASASGTVSVIAPPTKRRKSGQRKDIVTLKTNEFDELVNVALAAHSYTKENQMEEFRVACEIGSRTRPIVILLGGTSGTGKSTLASLLASRMGISTILSTDSVRHMLRNVVKKETCPTLFASTYHAGESLKGPEYEQLTPNARVIEGYVQQSRMVIGMLDKIISSCERKHEPLLVEGVHLLPEYIVELSQRHPSCVPFIVYISNETKHKERFAVRAKYMTLEPKNNQYIKYFGNIRLIQEYIIGLAEKHNIPTIDNSNIDRSLATTHYTIIKSVKKILQGDNKPSDPASTTHCS